MKRFAAFGICIGFVLTLWAGALPAAAEGAQLDCARTVNAYARAWDTRDLAGFVALFTDDASLDLGLGTAAKGKAAIGDLFSRVNPAATTRHLMTNILVTPKGADAAEGVSYLLLFAKPSTTGESRPLAVEGFALMGEYHDRFALSPGGCRFADRKLVTVFRRQAAAPLP